MALIDDARSVLHLDGVTDEGTVTRLNMIIDHGQAYLTGLCGAKLDYENDREAHALLMAYVRYAYNDAVEMFLSNFHDDIFRKQLNVAIALREEEANADQPGETGGGTDATESVG